MSSSSSLSLTLTHNGQSHSLTLSPDDVVETLKSQVFSLTSIPPESQRFPGLNLHIFNPKAKISQLNLKGGQTIQVTSKAAQPASAASSSSPASSAPQFTPEMLQAALRALPLFRQIQASMPPNAAANPSAAAVSASLPTAQPFPLPPQSINLSSCCSRSFFGTSPLTQPGALVNGKYSICFSCAETCVPFSSAASPLALSPLTSITPYTCQCTEIPGSECLFAARALIAADLLVDPFRTQVIGKLQAAALQQFTQNAAHQASSQQVQAQNQFHHRIQSALKSMEEYENPEWQAYALSKAPIEELNQRTKTSLANAVKQREIEIKEGKIEDELTPILAWKDQFLKEIMAWFKHEFFTWVNSPPCDQCGSTNVTALGGAPPSAEEAQYRAGIVEIYKCNQCQAVTRFPRYNHARKLLDTRRGRCGEWAQCFALFCRAFQYETRSANDWTDHIWVETFSEAERRWVHHDPCENTRDAPFLYEAGWGKKLNYIISTSIDEVRDVTRRYTRKWHEVLERRTLVTESWLNQLIMALNDRRRGTLSVERREELKRRDAEEEKEFLTNERWNEPDAVSARDRQSREREARRAARELKPEETQGRITGSVEWREARGEMGDRSKTEAAEEKERLQQQQRVQEKLKISQSEAESESADPTFGMLCDPETGVCTLPPDYFSRGKKSTPAPKPAESVSTPQKASEAPAASAGSPASSSSPDSEADKARVRQLFSSYHQSYVNGCGDSNCQNSLCRSSAKFEFASESLGANEIAQRCLQWTIKYKALRLCDKFKQNAK